MLCQEEILSHVTACWTGPIPGSTPVGLLTQPRYQVATLGDPLQETAPYQPQRLGPYADSSLVKNTVASCAQFVEGLDVVQTHCSRTVNE